MRLPSSRSRLAFGAVVLSASVGARAASAEPVASAPAPEPFKCFTLSSRTEREVIVPFGGEERPDLPEQAVRIHPGETLCIGARRNDEGELYDLVLLEQANLTDGPNVLLTLSRDEHTVLEVRHSGDRVLSYGAAAVITRQNLGIFSNTLPVAPGQTANEVWTSDVKHLLLFGFRLGEPEQPLESERAPVEPATKEAASAATNSLPSVEDRSVDAMLAASIGQRSAHFPEFDRALARDGFAPLPTTRVVGGFDLDVRFWRFKFGLMLSFGGATTAKPADGSELATRLWMGAVFAGFDVVRYGGFSLSASLGLGAGELGVDGRTPGFTLFSNVLESWEPSAVKFSHTLFPLELGYDYLVPLGRLGASEVLALQFGARTGVHFQLGGHWQSSSDEVRELPGPKLDASGYQYRFLLGLGSYTPKAN